MTLRTQSSHRWRRHVSAAAVLLACAFPLVLTACAGFIPGSRQQSAAPAPQPQTLREFQQQKPEWKRCGTKMECATVAAPLDWQQLDGARISLNLVKHRASSGTSLGTLFVNPGGPGASGVEYLKNGLEFSVQESVRERYDVVAWDPRGVAQSSEVRCLDTAGTDDYLFGEGRTEDLAVGSDAWVKAALEDSAAFAAACQKATGPLLAHVDTRSTAQDLDMLRAIVGDQQLNYLGYSYGTYIGAIYADMFPKRVGKVVLDGAIDPSVSASDVTLAQTKGFEQALRSYVTDCLAGEKCPFSGAVDDAMNEIAAMLNELDNAPIVNSDGRKLGAQTMLTAIVTPLYSPHSWGYLDDLFSTVRSGDASVAFQLADMYFNRSNGEYLDNSFEAFSAINCLDYPRQSDVSQMRRDAETLAKAAPTIGKFQGFGDLSCLKWPYPGNEHRAAVHATGSAPILVVGTTGDPATPYQWAQSLASQLDHGVLVTYRGEGHTAYGSGKSSCVNDVVDDFFVKGTVPAQDPQCTQ